MPSFLFTSESVGIGHSDKVCDQISDAILDACLQQDPDSRVACETLAASGLVVLAGEITTRAHVDFQAVARETIHSIGYNDCSLGFDHRSCGIIQTINKQSEDIARGVDESNRYKTLGAGDQGIMFGFASDETEELMPLPIMLAHRLVQELKKRREGGLGYLRPDAKSQVTVEYSEEGRPLRIHTVVLSTQHEASIQHAALCREMIDLIQETLPKELLDEQTSYFINPTGRFVIGGPVGDCGLTGRKTIVDTYGGMGHHGGGAFSGKDASKMDRSGSYIARYVAKNIVAAKLAKRCEVQISYAIGVPYPVSIKTETFGTGLVEAEKLTRAVGELFDLTPKGIIQTLRLTRPIFLKTAFGGHFGRNDPDFTWEKTDKAEALAAYFART